MRHHLDPRMIPGSLSLTLLVTETQRQGRQNREGLGVKLNAQRLNLTFSFFGFFHFLPSACTAGNSEGFCDQWLTFSSRLPRL